MTKSFSLTVRDREKILFEGEAISFSSANSKGNFDILSDHSNFISLVDEKITIRDAAGVVKEIEVGKGVIRVLNNKIDVFVGVGLTELS